MKLMKYVAKIVKANNSKQMRKEGKAVSKTEKILMLIVCGYS
jgi:hypothetical protein